MQINFIDTGSGSCYWENDHGVSVSYTHLVPSLVGKHVFDANKDIISMLEKDDNLFGVEEFWVEQEEKGSTSAAAQAQDVYKRQFEYLFNIKYVIYI